MNVVEEFRWRGMLQDLTEGAEECFSTGSRTAYIGFDPTASSLHVGSLVVIMALVHLQRAGHTPVALVGGGTGLIGDPSGKTAERQLLTKENAAENLAGIRAQLEHFLDFETSENPARVIDNHDWLGELSLIDFMRDIGKHFSVNSMIKKESVKRRLEDEETGISFTEFTYQLLQAYDFLELFRQHSCEVQMGGSDQWGNITAGIDLIRRVTSEKAFGLVLPLLATSSGAKFGKTEAGTIWLDPDRTSPYRFFQFWINVDDQDVGRFLRYFTLLSRDEIEEIEAAHQESPHQRTAQKRLASEVTQMVHGTDGLKRARAATQVLFGGGLEGLSGDEIADIFSEVSSTEIGSQALSGDGISAIDVFAESGLASSKGEARRGIAQGGMYINNVRVESVEARVVLDHAIEGRFLVLRKGKKSYHLVQVSG